MFTQTFHTNNYIKQEKQHLEKLGQEKLYDFLKTEHPIINSVTDDGEMEIIEKVIFAWKKQFNHMLLLGTGGSNLGAKTICRIKDSYSSSDQQTHMHFVDNIDPTTFYPLINSLPWDKTVVLIISKSGETAETLCQSHYVLKKLTKKQLAKQVLIITSPTSSTLRNIALDNNIQCLNHDPNLGGRFSAFSLVGLTPALFAGMNIKKIRQGATKLVRHLEEKKISSVAEASAFNISCINKESRNISVMMPYMDKMDEFSKWFRQLYAESIGKEGKGITPINSLGAVDQHSQIQLYLDGPQDKTFTIITEKNVNLTEDTMQIQTEPHYLNGNTMFKLFRAESKATIETLIEKDNPVRLIEIDSLEEETLGYLMMHYILETITTSYLLNINPFNQPAVEDGKNKTKNFLAEKDSC